MLKSSWRVSFQSAGVFLLLCYFLFLTVTFNQKRRSTEHLQQFAECKT